MNYLDMLIDLIDEKLPLVIIPLIAIMFIRIFYCIITH